VTDAAGVADVTMINQEASAAVLMASRMGAPLYRKMGFEDVGALRNAHYRP
jgi:hypothetical protein